MKNRLKTRSYTCQSLWIAGRRDSTVFGVVDDTTTTKFASRACAVHGISLPVVVVVLKFPNGGLKEKFGVRKSDSKIKITALNFLAVSRNLLNSK